MSKSLKQEETQLRNQIEEIQASLSSTLGELAYQAQPAVQVEHAKEAAKQKVEETKFDLIETWDAAKAGDREAIKKLLILAGAGAGVSALMVLFVISQTRRVKDRRQWRKFARQLRKTTPPGNISFTVKP